MSDDPYKAPESEPTALQTSTGATFQLFAFASWSVLVASSLLSLCFYRSAEVHGPDAVGREVTAFLLPCLIALFVSFFKTAKQSKAVAWRYPVGTILIGLAEVAVYTAFIL